MSHLVCVVCVCALTVVWPPNSVKLGSERLQLTLGWRWRQIELSLSLAVSPSHTHKYTHYLTPTLRVDLGQECLARCSTVVSEKCWELMSLTLNRYYFSVLPSEDLKAALTNLDRFLPLLPVDLLEDGFRVHSSAIFQNKSPPLWSSYWPSSGAAETVHSSWANLFFMDSGLNLSCHAGVCHFSRLILQMSLND